MITDDWESRRHWINMTEALRRGDMDGAQDVKIKFEGEQRKLEKERRQNGTRYEPRVKINVYIEYKRSLIVHLKADLS